ncbi:MAG TPA: hypothetical protein VFV19_02985 [Candidatus Polarisedimenticolaceae bacterium]|nr:hypothetical protein [Candidatus Polarisedimenticolaceae bacterium]
MRRRDRDREVLRDTEDPHRDRPRSATRHAMNRLAERLNAAHEGLAELRHLLGVAERLEPVRRKSEEED